MGYPGNSENEPLPNDGLLFERIKRSVVPMFELSTDGGGEEKSLEEEVLGRLPLESLGSCVP
jgi:hypothetical protein